jgi:hypothetical protein
VSERNSRIGPLVGGDVTPRTSLTLVAVVVAALGAAAHAQAAPIAAPAAIAGMPGGASLPVVSSVARATDGTTGIAGTVSSGTGRRVVAGVGPQPAVSPRGNSGDILSQPRVVVARGGRGAVVWSVGHRVLLSLCDDGRCAPAVTVGSSQRNPQAQVAVDPSSGRATVLWRGSASGRQRLQWRITTGGRLGPVHTLGEFGDTPRIGTDASGKTIAVWLHGGVRTAARRVGEFTRPATIATVPAQALRLAVASSGETVAAWCAPAPGGADVQSPRGTPVTASRTRDTAFGPVQPFTGVGDAGTLSVAVAGDGRAVLAFDRQADDVTATVSAAYRPASGLPFEPVVALGGPAFVSTAFGATAAIDDSGVATVAWGGSGTVSLARSDGAGAFAPAQALAPIRDAQSTAVLTAAAGGGTIAAWADGGGGWAATNAS